MIGWDVKWRRLFEWSGCIQGVKGCGVIWYDVNVCDVSKVMR